MGFQGQVSDIIIYFRPLAPANRFGYLGKTTFSSRIVGHLQELQARRQRDSFRPSLVFYFFKHSQTDKRNLTALFLSVCCQIAFQDDVALDRLYQSLLATEQHRVRSESLLRELATAAVTSQRFCFIVIDGMDECVGETASRGNSEGAIEWLESLLEERVFENVQQDKRSVHLLISGQRDGFLEERLRDYAQIRLDEKEAHKHEIEAYVTSTSYQIQQKFKIDEGLRMDVVKKACSHARGGNPPVGVVPQYMLTWIITQECSSMLRLSWRISWLSSPEAILSASSATRTSPKGWSKRMSNRMYHCHVEAVTDHPA